MDKFTFTEGGVFSPSVVRGIKSENDFPDFIQIINNGDSENHHIYDLIDAEKQHMGIGIGYYWNGFSVKTRHSLSEQETVPFEGAFFLRTDYENILNPTKKDYCFAIIGKGKDDLFIREDFLDVFFNKDEIKEIIKNNRHYLPVYQDGHYLYESDNRYCYLKWLYCQEDNTCVSVSVKHLPKNGNPMFPIAYFNRPKEGEYGYYYNDHSFIVWMSDDCVITYYYNAEKDKHEWGDPFHYKNGILFRDPDLGFNSCLYEVVEKLYEDFFESPAFNIEMPEGRSELPLINFWRLIIMLYKTNPPRINEGNTYDSWDVSQEKKVFSHEIDSAVSDLLGHSCVFLHLLSGRCESSPEVKEKIYLENLTRMMMENPSDSILTIIKLVIDKTK